VIAVCFPSESSPLRQADTHLPTKLQTDFFHDADTANEQNSLRTQHIDVQNDVLCSIQTWCIPRKCAAHSAEFTVLEMHLQSEFRQSRWVGKK
jgi:hypothetical protein